MFMARLRILVRMSKRINGFDAQAFLDSAGLSKKIVDYRRSEAIFSQGDVSDISTARC